MGDRKQHGKDPLVESRENIAKDIGTLRRILATKTGGQTFEQRLREAVARDIRGGPVTAPDGYPQGGAGPGQTNSISDPTGTTVTIRDSGNGALNDLVHDVATSARRALEDAVADLNRAVRYLDDLDKATGVAHDVPRCELCAHALKGTGLEPDEMFRFTDIGGRLEHNARVCQWHFDTVRKPPHAIPDTDRIRRRYTNGRDRVSA